MNVIEQEAAKNMKKKVCRPQTEFPGHPLTGCRAKNRWPWEIPALSQPLTSWGPDGFRGYDYQGSSLQG